METSAYRSRTPTHNQSVAQFLAEMAQKGAQGVVKTACMEITRELFGAKRLGYDASWRAAVSRTTSTGTGEFLDALPNIKLPFPKLWIEGPDPAEHLKQKDPTYIAGCTTGALIKPCDDGDGFSFSIYLKVPSSSMRPASLGIPGATITVSNKRGFDLDDQRLIDIMEDETRFLKQHTPSAVGDEGYMIDVYHASADFLLRSLAFFNSRKICPNMQFERSKEELREEGNDRFRFRSKFTPHLHLHKIEFDPSEIKPPSQSVSAPSVPPEYLGIGPVRGHWKHYADKDVWCPSHKRRKRSPGDTTEEATYSLTNSKDNLRLTLEGGRPLRCLAEPEQ